MSWRTHPTALAARSIGRKLGLNRLLSRLTKSDQYEDSFNNAFRYQIRLGDVIWDIGANIGTYSRAFSILVGDRGQVFAFEPSPKNYSRLTDAVADLKNVACFNVAIGARDGTVMFEQGSDELGATSRIVESSAIGGVPVTMNTADTLVARGDILRPTVVKIDVEGFEVDVLEGMTEFLASEQLRVFGIEVHFSLLSKRGLSHAPRDIERVLHDAGFDVKWCDASHLIAVRFRR